MTRNSFYKWFFLIAAVAGGINVFTEDNFWMRFLWIAVSIFMVNAYFDKKEQE